MVGSRIGRGGKLLLLLLLFLVPPESKDPRG